MARKRGSRQSGQRPRREKKTAETPLTKRAAALERECNRLEQLLVAEDDWRALGELTAAEASGSAPAPCARARLEASLEANPLYRARREILGAIAILRGGVAPASAQQREGEGASAQQREEEGASAQQRDGEGEGEGAVAAQEQAPHHTEHRSIFTALQRLGKVDDGNGAERARQGDPLYDGRPPGHEQGDGPMPEQTTVRPPSRDIDVSPKDTGEPEAGANGARAAARPLSALNSALDEAGFDPFEPEEAEVEIIERKPASPVADEDADKAANRKHAPPSGSVEARRRRSGEREKREIGNARQHYAGYSSVVGEAEVEIVRYDPPRESHGSDDGASSASGVRRLTRFLRTLAGR